jgi:hypothetical protein
MPNPALHLSTSARVDQSDGGTLITVRRGTADDRQMERVFAAGHDCRVLHEGRWLTLKLAEVEIINDLAVWRASQPH